MKIAFVDFWGGFDQQNNFFVFLIKQLFPETKVVDPIDANVLFCSVFGSEHLNYRNKKKIFYTGENVRPNFNFYDYGLSFDFESYGDKNIRLPLWYFYIDWFEVKSYNNPNYLIPVSYLNGKNEFSEKKKDLFCCTVFSAPHMDRFHTIRLLNLYKKVDGYGKCNERQVEEGERAKLDLISKYKFSICFENSIYPGYFTEKLLHAKIAGTIPIYKSDPTFNLDFNEKSCINVYGMSDQEILSKVVEIDNDSKLYESMNNEPLFLETPNIDWLKNIILEIL